ncbi:MAG: hypothetical protein WCK02_18110 [Bacteroidota bacterium]
MKRNIITLTTTLILSITTHQLISQPLSSANMKSNEGIVKIANYFL